MKSSVSRVRAVLPLASLLVWSACTLDPEPIPSRSTRGLVGLPTTSPRATRAYLASLDFSGPPKRSRVRCHAGRDVNVDIYPEKNSHLVDPVLAATQGRIVARVVNADTINCDDLHLAPNEVAYWWMGPNGGLPLRSDFWSIPPQGDIHHLAHTGPTIWHRDGQHNEPDAEIGEHPHHPAGGDDGDGDPEPVWFGHNSTWIACLGGCCESATLFESFQ